MIVRIALLCAAVLGIATLPALAQPQAPQPPKGRKDFIIEALEGQRNNANSGFAVCIGTYNDETTKLRQQIADLTAENTKLKKPADASPAPAADPIPK